MEQWYGNLPSPPIGLFFADLLLPCVKKKKKFKPLSQPQPLKFLAFLLSIESRKFFKKHFFCIIIPSLSESRFSSPLQECIRN